MSSTKSMPKEIATIRDKAIEFATGNGPIPHDMDDLYEWLAWESESAELLSDDWFFDLGRLHLSDEDLREFLELSDGAPVTNSLRIKYTRALIDRHADAQEEDSLACTFRLQKRDNPEVFACCLGCFAGQGGPEYEWFGLFPTRTQFFEHLLSKGWLRCGTPSGSFSDEAILRLWSK
jgi:hypothetical protein